jgi:hypothetical protein
MSAINSRSLASGLTPGLSDESAVSGQRAQVASLESTLPAAQSQEALAMNRITLLCGMAPGALNAELASSGAPLDRPSAARSEARAAVRPGAPPSRRRGGRDPTARRHGRHRHRRGRPVPADHLGRQLRLRISRQLQVRGLGQPAMERWPQSEHPGLRPGPTPGHDRPAGVATAGGRGGLPASRPEGMARGRRFDFLLCMWPKRSTPTASPSACACRRTMRIWLRHASPMD